MITMERVKMQKQLLYEIEIVRDANKLVATMNSQRKPIRIYESRSFEELLEQVAKDIQEENEDR